MLELENAESLWSFLVILNLKILNIAFWKSFNLNSKFIKVYAFSRNKTNLRCPISRKSHFHLSNCYNTESCGWDKNCSVGDSPRHVIELGSWIRVTQVGATLGLSKFIIINSAETSLFNHITRGKIYNTMPFPQSWLIKKI